MTFTAENSNLATSSKDLVVSNREHLASSTSLYNDWGHLGGAKPGGGNNTSSNDNNNTLQTASEDRGEISEEKA
jgi:hypothetical protein